MKRALRRALYALNELLPVMFWVFLMLGFDEVYIALMTLCAAAIHELGHYTAILLLKCDTGVPVGHFSGLRIKERRMMSYRDRIIVLAVGPAANLAVSILILPFARGVGYLSTFSLLNLITALSNLLPVEGYDGYSVLVEWARWRGRERAVGALEAISFITVACLALSALIIMYLYNGGYWLYGLFAAQLLQKMAKNLKYDVL